MTRPVEPVSVALLALLLPFALGLVGCFPRHPGPHLGHFFDLAPALGEPLPGLVLVDLEGGTDRRGGEPRAVRASLTRSIMVDFSSACAWEIATKHRLGKLRGVDVLARDMEGWVRRAGFRELGIRILHAQKAGRWPQARRDPFDRMLAAQSAVEDVPLVSVDPVFESFGICVIW